MDRKPPKKPSAPFTISVYAQPRGEPEIEEKILRAREEFEESLLRRTDWFLVVDDPKKAEIVVEVKALLVEGENRSELRTSVMGARSHTSHYIVADSRHYLYAAVTFFGSEGELTGSGKRKDEMEAASDLARDLERYVKKNYWELTERRELWRESEAPSAGLGREWIQAEVARRVETLGARVHSSEWSRETLVLRIDEDEFRFPFPPSGFAECVRALECQQLMVNQIVEHLEGPLGAK